MTGSPLVLLVAGEPSGDLHASALVRELRGLCPEVRVAGIGGPALRAAGMEILVDMSSVATMGLVEVLGSARRLWSAYRAVARFLDRERPDLVVLVDYPEFNLRLAARARRRGMRVFYYIGPQVWAWRAGRIPRIVERVDRMAVVFPFEAELYNRNGREIAHFVGHPLLDIVRPSRPPEETRRRYGLAAERPVVALLPGSREKEIRYLLAPLLGAARILSARGWQPVLAVAPSLPERVAADMMRALPAGVVAVRGDTYSVVAAADAAVVASGTATVETVLLGCPMVVVYRMAPLTYRLARRLVRVPYIAMPNLILGRPAFPELIQEAATAPRIVQAVDEVCARREELRGEMAEVRRRLGEPGAAGRAARLALELLGGAA